MANVLAILYISQTQGLEVKKLDQDSLKDHVDYARFSSDEEEEPWREIPNIIKDDLFARKVNLPSPVLKLASAQNKDRFQKVLWTRTRSKPWYNEFQGFRFVIFPSINTCLMLRSPVIAMKFGPAHAICASSLSVIVDHDLNIHINCTFYYYF